MLRDCGLLTTKVQAGLRGVSNLLRVGTSANDMTRTRFKYINRAVVGLGLYTRIPLILTLLPAGASRGNSARPSSPPPVGCGTGLSGNGNASREGAKHLYVLGSARGSGSCTLCLHSQRARKTASMNRRLMVFGTDAKAPRPFCNEKHLHFVLSG